MTYWGSFLTMVDFGRKTYIEFFLQSKIHTGKKNDWWNGYLNFDNVFKLTQQNVRYLNLNNHFLISLNLTSIVYP